MSMFAPTPPVSYQGLQILIPHPYRICQVYFQVIDRAFAFGFCLPVRWETKKTKGNRYDRRFFLYVHHPIPSLVIQAEIERRK